VINITQRPPTQIDSVEIERLLDERLILRILQPSLQKQIEQSIKHDAEASAFIFLYEGQMYLSLESIPQEEKRDEVYATIQRFQIDENANLSQIPSNLRGYLQTSKERRGRFIAAIALGALLGVMLGLMGMAVGVLVVSMTGLTDSVAGVGVTAVTFVACCALGWFLATYYLWRIRPLNPWKQ
jgi:hypothetical protein